jgi:3-oxoacyl-[acyl-carrier-protein] synthase-3
VTARATIVSTGSCLPGEPIDNARIESLAGPLPNEVLSGLQVQRRHWIIDPDTGVHHQSNGDLALGAAQQALERAGLEPADVDLLILSTSSPEQFLPPLSATIQDRLGLRRCATLDIRSGCAGAVAAMDIARLYLEAETSRNALVIGSEVISPLLYPLYADREPDAVRIRDRVNVYNFGDGAGAVVMALSEAGGILGSAMAGVGGGRPPGMEVFGGGSAQPLHEQVKRPRLIEIKVDVVGVGRQSPLVLAEGFRDVLRAARVDPASVTATLVPEGNAGYLVQGMREAGLDAGELAPLQDHVLENLADVAATGSAAVPLALDAAWSGGLVKPGDRLLILGLESSRWIYAGMVIDWTAPAPLGA